MTKESRMQLQALVALMLVAGGLPSALARMPFEADFGARLGPSLAKEPPPSSASTSADKASTSTRAIVDKLDQSQSGVLNQQSTDVGNAKVIKAAQTQSGALNKQQREIGIAAEGSKADVSAQDLNQQQRGALGNQKASVGNAGQ
jgi:hypothetical protein